MMKNTSFLSGSSVAMAALSKLDTTVSFLRDRTQTVAVSQVAYIDRPAPIYPVSSRRQGEQGTTMVRVLIDIAGRPTQVSVEKSSGFAASWQTSSADRTRQ